MTVRETTTGMKRIAFILLSIVVALTSCNSYNKVFKTNDYDFEELAEDISLATTVTKPDAQAVLGVIKLFITKALLAGRAVVLNDLGRFQISLQSKCFTNETMQADGFVPSAMIKGHRITFRPEVKLKQAVADGLSMKRISSEAMK